MIEFHYETDFQLQDESKFADWLARVVVSENAHIAQLDYIFCTDAYLLEKNQQYLNHDTYTDIITFDYSEGRNIAGDVFISVDRLKENSVKYNVRFDEEILRVMAHGALHLLGYKDKSVEEIEVMRKKEEEKIKLFHVEQ
ncbi:rRNA maturation RNase YbeY [Aggregatimonas sangjinii]|uniref:Endoribonuclease YbeY n=1 Tax=Aggregatimonas sangjinii TaxID=2583587 RepID=A0A5B7SXG4_9FLAO|nr:rRNA maturation RNase YbeY [Aggregatimonas sangjinii]QCX01883.1 rRNA maturation RNase YbeY [Aggregatimonas sangjinii]